MQFGFKYYYDYYGGIVQKNMLAIRHATYFFVRCMLDDCENYFFRIGISIS